MQQDIRYLLNNGATENDWEVTRNGAPFIVVVFFWGYLSGRFQTFQQGGRAKYLEHDWRTTRYDFRYICVDVAILLVGKEE